MSLRDQYDTRLINYLIPIAQGLENFFKEKLQDKLVRVDRISARAKSTDRFIEKAEKKLDGKPKYKDPLNEILDQVGVRIVTYYAQDVEIAASIIKKYLNAIEQKQLEPERDEQFGYIGKHFILPIPSEALGDLEEDEAPEHFELQIKTLFQHAWAEVNHDIAYKPKHGPLDREHARLVAYAAAQAWGADRIFAEIADGRIFKAGTVIE